MAMMSLLNQTTIKTAVVEDQPEIRDGLAMLINGTDGYECSATYYSMEEALDGIESDMPDVVLCDIGLPGMSGIEGIRILKGRYPGLLVLMLSIYDDDERIFDALCAGACGYLLKRTSPARLMDGIKEAVTGGTPISPDVASRLITFFKNIYPPGIANHEPAPEEERLLELMAEGHNYITAANELNISYSAVKAHMRNVYNKLQAQFKSETPATAARERFLK